MVRMHLPPGERSCRPPHDLESAGLGGAWRRLGGNSNPHSRYSVTFLEFLRSLPSREEQAAVINEVQRLWGLAERGELIYGHYNDVEWMRCTDNVLELRIGDTWDIGLGLRQHLRLFFTEPAMELKELLAVEFFGKRPKDHEAQEEQTAAAILVSQRLKAEEIAGFPDHEPE